MLNKLVLLLRSTATH